MFENVLSENAKKSLAILGEKPSSFSEIAIADAKDIAPMKIAAISDRGAKKDFVDLYFIVKIEKILSLDECLALYDKKFKALKQNKAHILKSLTYNFFYNIMANPEMGPQEPEEEIPQEPKEREETIEEVKEVEENEAPEMSPEDFQEMLAQLPIMEADLEDKREELESAEAAENKDWEIIAELREVIELLENEIATCKEIQEEEE